MPATRVAPPLLAAALVAALSPAAASAQSIDPYFEFLMARRLETLGDNAGALAALERAAAADEGSAEVRAEIASFYLRRSRRDDAEKAARGALAIDPNVVEAHRVLGQIYAANADAASERRQTTQAVTYSREAIEHLERVVTEPGADVNVHYALGRLYMRTGAAAQAVEAFARVLAQNPNSVQGRLAIAQAYAGSNDLGQAIAVLDEVLADEPRVAAALAQYQEQSGLLKDAAATYTIALSLAPRNRELKFRRASVLAADRDFTAAARAAAEAQKEHPDDARFPRLQARALYDGGSPARAFDVMEAAVRTFPRDAETYFTLAVMYREGDRVGDAVRVMRELIGVEPSNASALNYLGYMFAERGEQLDEAVKLVERALAVDPGNPAYLDSLGWAHFRRGDVNAAEKYLSPAAEKLPRNSVIQDHFGDLQASRGRWAEAIELWNRALQGDGEEIDRAAIERKIEGARTRVNRE